MRERGFDCRHAARRDGAVIPDVTATDTTCAAIADRPGIAPGFTAGAIASLTGAGFIGGIIGGLLAGMVALWFAGMAVPRFVRGLMPVVIIPPFTPFLTGLVV